MVRMVCIGIVLTVCAIVYMINNDKKFREVEITEATAFKHELKTGLGLLLTVTGWVCTGIGGFGIFLKVLFTPWQ